MSSQPKSKRRRLRRALWVAFALAFVLVAVACVMRVRFNGPALASTVESMLNERIRGEVQVESVEWPLGSIHRFAIGGWIPITVRGVKVWDENGVLVLSADHATADIDIHPAIFGRSDLILRDIEVPRKANGYAKIKQISEPRPAHQYDRHAISLLSAFYGERGPSFHAGQSAWSNSVFDLRNYHVEDATLDFEFPQFTARAENVNGSGFLYYDGSDPIASKLFYSLTPKARKGVIERGPLALELRNIVVTRLAQVPKRWPDEMVPRDLEYAATAEAGSDAKLKLRGAMLDSWLDIFGGDHDVTLTIEDAGAVAKALSGDVLGGDDLQLEMSVQGPVLAPKLGVKLQGLDVSVGVRPGEKLDLHLERAVATFDLATDSGTLEDTVATGAGGMVELAANFHLNPTSFDLNVEIPKAIELGPYLPDDVSKLAGTRLSGHLHAFGNRQIQRLDELNLKLGRASVTGAAYRTGDGIIHATDVNVRLGGTRIERLRGKLDGNSGEVDLDFGVISTDLQRWLRHVRAPTVATGMRGRVHVGGTFSDPTARGSLVATGIPLLDRMEAELAYRDKIVTVREAQSSALGGWVRGSGRLNLNGSPKLERIEAQGVNLKLSEIPVIGSVLTGEVDLSARASGPVSSPVASATAELSNWTIAGESYKDATMTVSTDRAGTRRVALSVERDAGGHLHIDTLIDAANQLSGAITLRNLPIDGLLAGGPLEKPFVGGTVHSELQLSGTLAAPTFDGDATIFRSWFQKAFLGTATLNFERAGPGLIRLDGNVFQDGILVSGTISTVPPFDADITVRVRRVEVDRFAPELAASTGARGWISGEVTWKGPLMGAGAGSAEVRGTLSEAVLLFDHLDESGRPAPIRVANRSPIDFAFDGNRVELLQPAVLIGPTGEFIASGSATSSKLDLTLKGSVAVGMLAPYLRQYFDSMSGNLEVEARVTGRPTDPRITGVVQIDSVALKPTGQEAIVRVPAGKIDFSNDQLALTGLSMVVADEFSNDKSELKISGGVRLDNFTPALWAIRIDGQLAGKMLLVVAPDALSSAAGYAEVSVALLGIGRAPNIDGSIEFQPEDPLTLTPRGAGREIALTGGAIRFTDDLVEVENVRGWMDDEGRITNVSGEVSLQDWQPVDIDVSVSARDLPFRVPQEIETSVTLSNVRVMGDAGGIEISGLIEIVDGRYVRKFNPVIDALRPARSTESSTPFYDGIPLLANARLNLIIATRAFFVQNNIANIELSGEVEVTGTPKNPRFAGVVRVEQGSWKFQGIRARFEQTSGTVTFSPYQEFPEDTPVLDVRSESNYRDISGNNHLVNLNVQGPISKLDVDLSTQAGLNKAQTLTLIFAGRTPDDARETLLGDQPIGRRTASLEGTRSTVSSDNTFQAADQLVKDLAGDFFGLLIEDRLRDLTGLDVARLQVGTASVGVHGEKDITKSLKIASDVERTLRGWSWDLRGEYRINDRLSIDGEVLRKRFDDEAEEDDDKERVKATWRFLIP